jgi:hypothetical protein
VDDGDDLGSSHNEGARSGELPAQTFPRVLLIVGGCPRIGSEANEGLLVGHATRSGRSARLASAARTSCANAAASSGLMVGGASASKVISSSSLTGVDLTSRSMSADDTPAL